MADINTHAISLNGSSQYAYITDANQTGLDITGALTIELWIKFESLPSSGNTMYLVNKYIGLTGLRQYGFRFLNDSGTYKLAFRKADAYVNFEEVFVDWTPSVDTWYHIAVTYNGTDEVKFYIDASQQGSTQSITYSGIGTGNTIFSIGCSDYGGSPSNFFDGLIDEVRIWNVVRTPTEINANKSKRIVSYPGLVASWSLDNTLTDSSGNSNTLTNVGSATFSTDVSTLTSVIEIKVLTEVIKAISSSTKSTGKMLSQSLKVITSLTKIGTFLKTLAEIIKVVSTKASKQFKELLESFRVNVAITKILSAFNFKTLNESILVIPAIANVLTAIKELTERIIVAPAYSTILTANKTLTETVKVVGSIIKRVEKTFNELVKTIDETANVKTIFIKIFTEIIRINELAIDKIFSGFKVFIEQVKVLSSSLFSGSFYKIMVERVVVSGIYQRVWAIYKIFTEIVIVSSSKLVEMARAFNESLKVNPLLTTMRSRILTQIVSVSQTLNSSISRIFTENVIVHWQRLSRGAYVYIQNLRVGSSKIFSTGRIFVERILGSTSWEFVKTQFVDLTEHLKVILTFTKRTGRIFVNIIKVRLSNFYNTGRTFVQGLSVGEWFQAARSYTFSEIVKVSVEFGSFAIGKVLNEIVKVRIIFTEGRNKIMSEIIRVSDNFRFTFIKIFSEIINVVSSRVSAIGRTLVQIVKMADTKRFRKTQFKVLYDRLSATNALFKATGRTLKEVVIAVGSMSSWAIGKLLIEIVKVRDSVVRTWTLSRVFSEIIKVSGNAFNQGAKIFSEVLAISSEFILGTISKLFIEIIKIVEDVRKSLPAKSYSESIVVSDSVFKQAGKTFTEAVIVASEFILGTISKLFIEIVKVIDNYSKAWTLSRVFSETVKVVGNLFNQAGLIFAETISVVGSFVLGTISKLLIETVKVYGIFNTAITRTFNEIIKIAGNAYNQAGKIFSEIVSVVGTMMNFNIGKLLKETVNVSISLVRTLSRVFTQVINAVELTLQTAIGRVFNEIVSIVSPTALKSIGRTFTETVIAGWSKIKLVLNGIQVGLWKKVARVTNGVWRKISRNDN